MSDAVLTEKVELKKGKHLYVFDPAKFNPDRDEMSPVFSLDDRVISVDGEGAAAAYEGCAFLVCGCDDYKERERKFEANESYKKEGRLNLEWGDVATCKHITLINRYFSKYLLQKVLEEVLKKKLGPSDEYNTFVFSREAGIFPRTTLRVIAEYLGKKESKKAT